MSSLGAASSAGAKHNIAQAIPKDSPVRALDTRRSLLRTDRDSLRTIFLVRIEPRLARASEMRQRWHRREGRGSVDATPRAQQRIQSRGRFGRPIDTGTTAYNTLGSPRGCARAAG